MDTKKKKIRDFKVESRILFITDAVLILIAVTAAYMLFPATALIGARNKFVLGILNAAFSLLFMGVLEKYKILPTDFRDKTVSTVLSLFYNFVIMNLINLFFFLSAARLAADGFILVSSAVLIIIKDLIFTKISGNQKHFRRHDLLIIDNDLDDLSRMQKVKYSMNEYFNGWYETLDGMTPDEIRSFARENFPSYDGICVFKGFSEQSYSIISDEAVKANLPLFIVPRITDISKLHSKLVRFDDIITLYVQKYNITAIEFFIKRIMDIVISLVMAVLAAIPMLLIAAAIKISSPGPVFYKQLRLTRNKKEFWIYKFRTMIPDAEKLTGPKFAEKDDPRITGIGKILRACRLDELPQILNILKGDMSIVGPRPERPEFVEQFRTEVENYDYRFAVKAGLTSLSHVYGRYSTHIYDRTCYDLYYIANYSILLDLKIILLTTKTMFSKTAAEGIDTSSSGQKKNDIPEESEIK